MLRVSSEVLGVVCIDTLVPVVFGNVWTEHGFVLVQVEKLVLLHVVDHLDDDFRLTVSKGAVASVLALVDVVWVVEAELSFMSFRVVQLLEFIMGKSAAIAIWTHCISCDVWAHRRSV